MVYPRATTQNNVTVPEYSQSKSIGSSYGVRRAFNREDPELATDDDIRKVFQYCGNLSTASSPGKSGVAVKYLVPTQFIAVLHLVVGHKSQLAKEMQTFKK